MKLLLVFIAIIALILLAPYPYYAPENVSWHIGPSLLGRSIGNTDEGKPLDKIVGNVLMSSITSPFEIACETNSDCTTFAVSNQCKVYCANGDPGNQHTVEQLEKDRVCDAGMWRKPDVKCYCVFQKCIDL